MNRFLHLATSRFEYSDLRRHLDIDHDDVRALHSPASGIPMCSNQETISPRSPREDYSRVEELDRQEDDERGVIILKNIEQVNEDDDDDKQRDKKDDIDEQSGEKDDGDDEKDSKEDDKNAETFVAVIAQSILSVPTKRMTLSSIYSYIASHYPHFDKEKGPGWRNSVRHNLSSNDCFVKASRAENGKGHYWMIHPKDLPEFSKGNFRRRRKPRRPKCSHSLLFRDSPLYYHSFGLGYSPYSYTSLRSPHELTDYTYGTSSERALASYRSRLGLYDDSSNRYSFGFHPYSSCPSTLALRYSDEAGLLRSPTGSLGSSFVPVGHYSCSCHRCQPSSKEGHFVCS